MRLFRMLSFAKAGGASSKPIPKCKDDPQNWRWRVSGLKWEEMKKHYSIIPMYAFSILAMGLAGGYVLRLATKHPEVTWSRKRNPEPWNDYTNRQYKFVNTGRDYSKASPAPPYK